MRAKLPTCLHQIQPWGKATLAPASSHTLQTLRTALHCGSRSTEGSCRANERERPVSVWQNLDCARDTHTARAQEQGRKWMIRQRYRKMDRTREGVKDWKFESEWQRQRATVIRSWPRIQALGSKSFNASKLVEILGRLGQLLSYSLSHPCHQTPQLHLDLLTVATGLKMDLIFFPTVFVFQTFLVSVLCCDCLFAVSVSLSLLCLLVPVRSTAGNTRGAPYICVGAAALN